MVKCCVPWCHNASYRKTPEITFHRFPKEEILKNAWVKNINRKNWQPSSSSVICSKHFEANLLSGSSFRTVLAPGAIPTIFEEFKLSAENKENESLSPEKSTISRKRTAIGNIVLHDVQNAVLAAAETQFDPTSIPGTPVDCMSTGPSRPETFTVQPGPSCATPQKKEFQNPLPVIPVAQLAQPSTSTIHGTSAVLPSTAITPRPQMQMVQSSSCIATTIHSSVSSETSANEKLKKKVIQKNKKIKCLQEQKRRMKKKVQQFSAIIEELRKKLNDEEMQILSNIPVKNKDFMVRYLKKVRSSTVEKSYPPEIRSFALQLNFYSPRAYNFVRQQFNTVLPHPVTLSRWYKKIDAQPGFTGESFETLESLSKNSESKIFVNLSIDEMAIRKEQVWDRASEKFKGHVDTGTGVADDSLPLATQALVIMVTAINACWKIPIAFFFISSMTGEQRANIVKIAIGMLYNINIFVHGLTFDGATTNISMATNLGCDFNLNTFRPFFLFKDLKIYAFYDPCHMLKLIRNCLGDFKNLIDKDGNYVKFEYLISLLNLSEEKGLHLGVKIRKAHIYFKRQKMKVRLAAQLFSKSVADALIFCKDVLKLEQFRGCAATVDFVILINDCFDILNSRTSLAPGNKKALCAANIERVKEFVKNATEYLVNLKFSDGKKVVHSVRKTGFLGFIICLHNVLNLYNDLLNSGRIIYLSTYKISQDHLEMFFGKIRSKGGFNDNPNVVQFQTAYKKNIICTELKLREKGMLIDSNILNFSSTKSIDTININTPNRDINNIDLDNIEEENMYLFMQDILDLPLDDYSKHIVTYIAGFISRRIVKKLKCLICQQLMIGDKGDFLVSLINTKDRGGLVYPSKAVIKIVKQCENFIKIEEKTISYEKFMMYFIKDVNNIDILNCNDIEHDPQHLYLLLKSIVKMYLDVRCNHLCKSDLVSERNYLKKTVLFKNK